MLYVLCIIITFNNNIPADKDKESKISVTNNAIKLGRLITGKYLSLVYKEFCKHNPNITFSKFKEEFLDKDKNSLINSDEFLLRFGTTFIEIMETSSLLSIKVVTENKNQSLTILRISDNISSILDRENPVLVTPLNLPMIIKPKPYSKGKLGGYLLNDVEYSQGLIVDKLSYSIPSKIKENNIIYKVVNNMMSTPFKVNKDLLDYLLNKNHIHNLLIDRGYVHEYANLVKRNKSQEKKYQEFLSKKIMEEYIIEIAKTYANAPEFYFPIKLDNRGRLYPLPVYFNYQGFELAKALILFASPDIIRRNDTVAIEYLKSYGAACFGNGYNRKSYTERIA
jgi:DNA-directed RNA polymerase